MNIIMLQIGGEVHRLIPALSLLKDGRMHNQLRKSFYENVRACFESKQGAAGKSIDCLERVCHIIYSYSCVI